MKLVPSKIVPSIIFHLTNSCSEQGCISKKRIVKSRFDNIPTVVNWSLENCTNVSSRPEEPCKKHLGLTPRSNKSYLGVQRYIKKDSSTGVFI